ncbi:MAG: dihydropteroate synthase [Gemmatimonadetes bacterium]|nr:dihydropteroate synthase [Gemmatimonadota bacterium]
MPERVLFVTGKLAAPLLRDTLERAAPAFAYDVAVMKITVAALMTPEWIARFLEPPPGTDLILLPGRIQGDVAPLAARFGIPVEKGPRDLREIPEYFGLASVRRDYGAHDIEILAEIHDAPSLEPEEILRRAAYYAASGADIIDVGCSPGRPFPALGEVVRALRAAGHRVSIDSFDAAEVRTAVAAGAELVLSVNGSNLELARELDATVVVIPDSGQGLDSLDRSIEALERWGARYLIDPILEPIGYGFAESLWRYREARRRQPEAEMLMGIANITELTDADTTGMNALLIGFCQELGIRHVLTTEDAAWARGAVREVDVARRLMHYALEHRTLPKRVDPRLVTVKDPDVVAYGEAELRAMQARLTDPNYRIYTDRERIYVFNAERFVVGTRGREIFERLDVHEATHAFYLGRELTKAELAVTLGKTYRQEAPLAWGYLTPAEEDGAGHARADRADRLRVARERADRRRAAARRRAQNDGGDEGDGP